MAVQGKLVPQDPSDEPAHILLERIRAEKVRLIKEKKIKKEKNPSVIYRGTDNLHYEKFADGTIKCIEDEIPFEVPESWGWERIRNIGTIIRGNGIKRSEIIEDGFPCVRYGEIYTTYNISFSTMVSFIAEELHSKSKHFSYGDILMTLTGENKPDIAKAVAYLGKEKVAASGDLGIWSHHGMNPLYLVYLLDSPCVIEQKIGKATGNIIVHISGEKIGEILVSIPPLNEQERIVQKVQDLESSLRAYQKKEHTLVNLQTAFPSTLEKSILQHAVQGKLVPQDESDEPASVLLEGIRAEKEELIKQGKLKKDKHESVIFRRDNSYYERLDGVERCIDDEIPFEIPKSWEWIRLGTGLINRDSERIPLSVSERGNLTKTYDYYGASGVIDKVDRYLFDKPLLLVGEDGANLLLRTKPVAFIARGRYWVNNHAHVLDSVGGIDLEYVALHINSISLAPYVTGTAQPKMNQEKMNSILVPLPPVPEQKRIVQAVQNIFMVIQQL